MTRTAGCSTLALLLLVPAGSLSAQGSSDFAPNWSASAVVSTLGIGLELTGRANPLVGIRGGYFLYSHTWHDHEVEGITYDVTPKLQNGEVLLDLHPGGGLFRLSGGVLFAKTKLEALGVLSGPTEIGDVTYLPADVGTLSGKVAYEKSVLPYVGLGIASQARFTVTFDIGVAFSGYPKATLSADSPLTGSALAELEANLSAEEVQIQNSIESHWWAKFFPVVSLGLKYKF